MLESETELAAAAASAAAGALRAMELGGSASVTPSSSMGDMKSSPKNGGDAVRERSAVDGASGAKGAASASATGGGGGHYKTLRRTRKYVVNGETHMTTSERIILQGEEGRFHEEFDARYSYEYIASM